MHQHNLSLSSRLLSLKCFYIPTSLKKFGTGHVAGSSCLHPAQTSPRLSSSSPMHEPMRFQLSLSLHLTPSPLLSLYIHPHMHLPIPTPTLSHLTEAHCVDSVQGCKQRLLPIATAQACLGTVAASFVTASSNQLLTGNYRRKKKLVGHCKNNGGGG